MLPLLGTLDIDGASPVLLGAAAVLGGVLTVGVGNLRDVWQRRRFRRDVERFKVEYQSPHWSLEFESDGSEELAVSHSGSGSPLHILEAAPEPRFANVVLTDLDGVRPVVAGYGSEALLTVDIGPLTPFSDVDDEAPQPFPDEMLPERNLEITVLLSSAELDLGREGMRGSPGERGVEEILMLPGNGGASQSKDGTGAIRFRLALPGGPQVTRARLSYLYRDTVVQSQRLDLTTRATEGGCVATLSAITDFTISEHLDVDLGQIADRDRVTVVVNANSLEEHEVTVRPSSGATVGETTAFRLKERALSRLVAEMREGLSERSPTSAKRSSQELRADLRTLAPIGWRLYSQLGQDAGRMIAEATPEEVVQVAMPEESGFTLPWHLVYDIFIDSSANAAQIPVCPIVDDLGTDGFAFAASTRQCPYAETRSHAENLLCPFGFWGFRHTFELLASSKAPATEIEVGSPSRIVLAKTEVGLKKKALDSHFANLTSRFEAWSAEAEIEVARSKQEVRAGITADLPFVYFLCHGSRSEHGDTVLGVGRTDTIEPADFVGWAGVERNKGHTVWTSPRPLVFINACESLAIDPDDLIGYLGAFIETGQAVGVIGTETRVNPAIAMDVGETFFARLLEDGGTVEEALWEVRLKYLATANLAGLLYTPYCFADLHIATDRESAVSAA